MVLTVRVLTVDGGTIAIVAVQLHLLLLREDKLGEASLIISKVLGPVLIHYKVVVGVVLLTFILLGGLALLNLPLCLLLVNFLSKVNERNLGLDLLPSLPLLFDFVTPQLAAPLLHLLLAVLPDSTFNVDCLVLGRRVLALRQVVA